MKKKLLKKTAAVSLALLTAFAFMACSDDPDPEPEVWRPTGDEPDSDLKKLHDMILPAGTGATVPAWTVADDGVKDLPAFVTGFLEKGPAPAELKEGSEGYELYNDKFIKYNGKTNRTPALKEAIRKANAENFFDDKEVKNVLMIFCDGWGESHLQASKTYYGDVIVDELPYHALVNHNSYPKQDSSDAEFGWTFDEPTRTWSAKGKSKATGLSDTTCTDSTAGGTAINTGFTTRYGYCDLDSTGKEVRNLADLAREKGMLVGNVTNDWTTDATPATVSIQGPTRKNGEYISGREFITSPDFLMGNGGYGSFVSKPSNLTSSSEDYRLLKSWYEADAANWKAWAVKMLKAYDNIDVTGDYDFAKWPTDRKMKTKDSFSSLMTAIKTDYDSRYVVGFNKSHKFDYDPTAKTAPSLGYKLGYKQNTVQKKFPNYAEMVASTLTILDHKSKANNDCGFYCLIENTCSDGWGHASQPYDCLNETQIFDEGVAIAIKYVLENPNTLLVVTADHETGDISYEKGWDTDYTQIWSNGDGHSTRPVPVFAFGAGAKEFWGDCEKPDMSNWSADDIAKFTAGKHPSYPVTYKNRETGIRIGKAMGFTKFGDLNGNGVLDLDTESDSVVSFTKVNTFEQQ